MNNQAGVRAETSGKEFYTDHPAADHATAEQVARNQFSSVYERECFVAGWNIAFWDHMAIAIHAKSGAA